MISSGYKKLAREFGMTCASGVAYGSLRGYAATFQDGMDIKTLGIAARFPDEEAVKKLGAALEAPEIRKQFRIQDVSLSLSGMELVFHDTVGTLKRIRSFIDWFWPILEQSGASRCNICTECGMEMTAVRWKLVEGIAYPVHEACGQRMERMVQEEAQEQTETGSYLGGAVGAFLGALLGAVVWAAVLLMGYIAAVVGLLIGWLSIKGYQLFHGKRGKAMILILILALILGVCLGTVTADVFSLARMIQGGELPGFGYGDIPWLFSEVLLQNGEYLEQTGINMLGGFFFAALGAGGLLFRLGRETADVKIKDLP